MSPPLLFSFFFFNDTATTEIYTLSLHDALPIFKRIQQVSSRSRGRRSLPPGTSVAAAHRCVSKPDSRTIRSKVRPFCGRPQDRPPYRPRGADSIFTGAGIMDGRSRTPRGDGNARDTWPETNRGAHRSFV